MSDDKALERSLAIVQKLYDRTREGKVDWQPADDARAFRTDFNDLDLIIHELPDPDYPDEPDYSLEIAEKFAGRIIETISNQSLRPVMDRKNSEGLNPYALMHATFEMARRKALKVDDALQNLLNQLQ